MGNETESKRLEYQHTEKLKSMNNDSDRERYVLELKKKYADYDFQTKIQSLNNEHKLNMFREQKIHEVKMEELKNQSRREDQNHEERMEKMNNEQKLSMKK